MAAGALPNLLVIGAAKCGTSSLHYYLGLHPEIQMAQPKELQFFIADEDMGHDLMALPQRELALLLERSNGPRGTDWYRRFFDQRARVRGESTVAYSFPWYRGVAARAAALLPDAKLIYLVRHPVERAISHYSQYRGGGREWRPLETALQSPANPYLAGSRYNTALAPYLREFPRAAIHVVDQQALLEDRRTTMREIFSFLEVEAGFWSPAMTTMRNRAESKGSAFRLAERARASRLGAPLKRLPTGAKLRLERLLARRESQSAPELSPEPRAAIAAQLEPELQGLEALTGWDLTPWRPAGEAT